MTENNQTATEMTNQLVANSGVLWTKLHQFHWYVKGSHFLSLHEKFEALYNETAGWYDELAEVLLAMGVQPFSTSEQNSQHAIVKEDAGFKSLSAEEMVKVILEDFQMTQEATSHAIKLAQDEEQSVLEDTLIGYKKYLDKQIWILNAFLGKSV